MSAEASRKRGGGDPDDVSVEKIPNTSFDESILGLHDVIVNVRDKKFYCVKLTLARHSRVFHRIFVLDSLEKNKKEVTIGNKVTPDAFELFLHMINGFSDIKDDQIENLLQSLNHLEAFAVKSICETFLLEKSKMTLKEKFHIAEQNKFERLKIQIIDQITDLKTYNDVLSDEHIDGLSPTSKLFIIKQFKTTLVAHEKSKDDIVVVYDRRKDQNNRIFNQMWCTPQFGQGIQAPAMFPSFPPFMGNWTGRGGYGNMQCLPAPAPPFTNFANTRVQQGVSQFQGPMNLEPPTMPSNFFGNNSSRGQ